MSEMTAEQVSAWIEETERTSREEMLRSGPNPEWSISVSLRMIEAARAAGITLQDPNHEEQVEQVRRNWERLRKAFGVGPGS